VRVRGRMLLGVTAAVLAVWLVGCGPGTPPQPPQSTPADFQRRVLLRPGGIFVQARLDRVRTWLPSLGEIVTLAWTPSLPGASCLLDLLWSADVVSAFLATPPYVAPPTSGAALVDGAAIPEDRVPAWVDCVLAGLGSGSTERLVPLPAEPPAGTEGAARPSLSFKVGTGSWNAYGLGLVGPGRWGLVAGEPFDTWARELAGAVEAPDAPPSEAGARVADADVQLVWLDAEAVADLLARGSAGLGLVPPPEELRGLAVGLWLGDASRAEAYVQARGPESATAVADALRTFATVLQLGVSVRAAQLGAAYGADIQARAEQVAAIAERAVIESRESLATVRLELTPADLDLIQGFALALASEGLADEPTGYSSAPRSALRNCSTTASAAGW